MITIAGILFVIAALVFAVDYLFDNVDINLLWLARALVVISLLLLSPSIFNSFKELLN